MFRVIIAGGRYYEDYNTLKAYADRMLSNITDEIQIVSGGASGADALGERYAKEKGYSLKRFPADWNSYGRSAGVKRNRQMAQYADALIAFWDGVSRGTKNMIDEATSAGLLVRVKRFQFSPCHWVRERQLPSGSHLRAYWCGEYNLTGQWVKKRPNLRFKTVLRLQTQSSSQTARRT